MTSLRAIVLSLSAFLSSFITVSAQQQWNLQQCIDYALEHNLSIKQSELNVELDHDVLTQSTFNYFPTLNGFASNNYFFGRSIDPYTNQFTENRVRSNSFSLSSSLSLFEGFRLHNTLTQSKLNYMSSKLDLQKIKNDISLNIVTAYLQVLYNRELLAVAKDQRDATVLQRDKTKRMEELGAVSKGNLLDIESQLATDEVTEVTAQGQLDVSVLGLKQLLQLDTVQEFSIVQPVITLPKMDAAYANIDAIYETALTNQPDVKSSDYKVVSAEKGLNISKSGLYPRIMGNGTISTTFSTSSQRANGSVASETPIYLRQDTNYYTVYSISKIPTFEKTPFNDQLDNNLGKSVGFTMNIPIFNNWSTQTNIKRARLNLQQSRLNNEQLRQTLYKNIQQAVIEANTSFNKYQAGEKSVAAKEQALNYDQQRFDVGLISTNDFLISKNNLARAKADLLQARYDYIFRTKVLDFYMGKPLSF